MSNLIIGTVRWPMMVWFFFKDSKKLSKVPESTVGPRIIKGMEYGILLLKVVQP